MSDGAPFPENRLQAMAVGERPQERLERLGPGALSDAELLAMLLRSGTQGQDVMTLATRLLTDAGSLGALTRWNDSDFRRAKGIGPVKAAQLRTVFEVATRVLRQATETMPVINTAGLAADYLRPLAQALLVEKFWVLCLNRKNRLIKCAEVTSGTATSALAHPREVFREALRASATAIIAAHNHPSGDPSPSAADVQVTRQLREAARTVDIALLDHVIVGSLAADPTARGYYSFREAGVL
ncbi:DNA repair protein RadC [Horticoccus luteus]|uniref:DNA repair protein RadC n=1 Tax=Horticoccus luteus TaxID=2862869 RepID=A0A8F9TYP5_9BACT|nr:DNA repair protein RadC [Horticoccus luteus]QYM80299.1 DNA repair protein RadC [Horticoccus luteus]